MPESTPAGYLLLGLTAIIGLLAGVLGFSLLRLMAAARDSSRYLRESNVETALLSAALQEAVTKLKAQERSTLARAEASERLNAQIVDGLTSGLLVARSDGQVLALNPAGHRILALRRARCPPISTSCSPMCRRWPRWCAKRSTAAAPQCRGGTSPPASSAARRISGSRCRRGRAGRPARPASSACSPTCRGS